MPNPGADDRSESIRRVCRFGLFILALVGSSVSAEQPPVTGNPILPEQTFMDAFGSIRPVVITKTGVRPDPLR